MIKKLYSLTFVPFLQFACGAENRTVTVKKPAPVVDTPITPETPPATGFADIEPILQADCALSGCHKGADFLSNERSFRRSSSLRRIEINSMPPPGSLRYDIWTEDKKQFILAWGKQ